MCVYGGGRRVWCVRGDAGVVCCLGSHHQRSVSLSASTHQHIYTLTPGSLSGSFVAGLAGGSVLVVAAPLVVAVCHTRCGWVWSVSWARRCYASKTIITSLTSAARCAAVSPPLPCAQHGACVVGQKKTKRRHPHPSSPDAADARDRRRLPRRRRAVVDRRDELLAALEVEREVREALPVVWWWCASAAASLLEKGQV